ncbi:DUF5067 domain-containing protein [Zongyangia sp. HA2173]|uniref:DUF5067 domain-containing protein n=1 Tax=Zongyangia sp. HA2173 TaxID=3133035 RepID=UPI0031679BAC
MKKIISLILAISCILCLASCSKGPSGELGGLDISIGSARIEKNILDQVVIIIGTNITNISDENQDLIYLHTKATQGGKELKRTYIDEENTTTTLAPGASCLMEMSFELNTKDEIVKFSVAPPYVRGNVSKEFDPELLLL